MKEKIKNNKNKVIALLGGSFNPPHEGHFKMAKYVADSLKVDEVWFLFSTNVFKDPSEYAPVEHRMAMGRLMAKFYHNYNFKMKDVESSAGSKSTVDILHYLRLHHRNCKFVWVMGADNLAQFNKWKNYEEIIETTPIAVVDRPDYTEKALKSFTAMSYPHLRTEAKVLGTMDCGWCMLNNPKIEVSSSDIRQQLRHGKNRFGGHFQKVADYIRKNHLYAQ